MPDRSGQPRHITPQHIDYMRGLEDPRMDTQNRTNRTFPIDMVKDRDYMRSQRIQPMARTSNIVYTENPFKYKPRRACTNLAHLKYSDRGFPVAAQLLKCTNEIINERGESLL